MKFLSDVFDDYLELAKVNNHKIDIKHFNNKYKSSNAIFQLIPDEFKNNLSGRLE